MTALLAILISGVLLDSNDKPMPKYDLVFIDANLTLIKITTDKDGKFQVNLAPGTYRFNTETIIVEKNTSALKLKLRRQPLPPDPHLQGDFPTPPSPRIL